ncbi:MAG: hypothetical protein LWX56_12430 [Ignavibacteria bacterium]|nr:hypothetical protein [Ignavibacteria bacterium]
MKKLGCLIILIVIFLHGAAMAQFKPQQGSVTDTTGITLAKAEALARYNAQKKNSGLAALYSMILPGMGELYADSYNSGKYFTMVEVALWVSYFGMDYYAGWQKDNYMAYARQKGGVSSGDHSSDFYGDIANYTDINQFNDEKSFQGEFGKMYNTSTDFWRWESTGDRRTYRNMWLGSQHATNNLRFVVSAMVLNRIASAINAMSIVTKANKQLKAEQKLTVGFEPILERSGEGGLRANLTLEF